MALGLWTAMYSVVLGRGDHLEVLRIIALQAGHKGDAQLRGQEGILTVGFLASPPTWVAENVDVGRPEGESVVDAVIIVSLRLAVLGPRLSRNNLGLSVNQVGVPGGRHADGLREHRGISRSGDSV